MKQAARKVWHVFRFRERFELPDDLRFDRRRPLLYSRDFVSAGDDESGSYLRQIDAMSRRQNGLELEGSWSRIRRAASARSLAFRGYLLSIDNEPASDAEIARTILFCEPRRAARILKSLEEIGLLEQARCPIFDLSQNDVTPKKRKKTPGNKVHRSEGKSRWRESGSRETTRNTENPRAPLEKKKRINEKQKTKKKRNPESEGLSGSAPDTGRAREPKEPCPPTALQAANPKTNPQEPGAGDTVMPSSPSPRPAFRGGEPQAIGSLAHGVLAKIDRRAKWQDPEAVAFGYQVFEVLWPGRDPESDFGKGERGAFTEWLHKQGPLGSREAMIEKGLKQARHVAKHRRSYRNPAAGWFSIVKPKGGSQGEQPTQRAVA